jgi:hypothetical protein
VEILIVTAMSIALSTVVLELSRASASAFAVINGEGLLQLQMATAMTHFVQDARLATRAPATWGPYTQDLDSADGNNRAVLILEVPAINASGQVLVGVADRFIYDFDATTGILQRIVAADEVGGSSRTDQTHLLGRTFTRVLFNLATANEVQATWWASRTEGQRTFTLTLTLRSSFRNAP